MNKTPKSLRLHLGIFGRTNVGKSSFLNMICGQDAAITSSQPGTTTDVVEKTMELLPIGPVVFMDTAGLDDVSSLGEKRIEKARKVFEHADIIFLLTTAGEWDEYEDDVLATAQKNNVAVICVINKIDMETPTDSFVADVTEKCKNVITVSSVATDSREDSISQIKQKLIDLCPDDFLAPPPLIGDLLPDGGMAALIVPIDLEAPKGRLILPQVQTIRDCLDNDCASLVVKDREFKFFMEKHSLRPDLVVCDSQVVLQMVADTPTDIKCTTFSILFARYKGDLPELAKGGAAIENLRPGDNVLIAESCSHHPIEDDIGRVKIPRWLKQYVGGDLNIDTVAGKDFPKDVGKYKVIIHCGGCMFNRRQMLFRIDEARRAGVPITNYGVAISAVHGVLDRVLEPFPYARECYAEMKG